MKFTDQAEALAYLSILTPPITVAVYNRAGNQLYWTVSADAVHPRYVIDQSLGPGSLSGCCVTLDGGT